MGVTATVSNHAKYQFAAGNVDLSSDVLKVILMGTGYSFDKDTHATLADITANQIATGNGYVQNDKSLAGVSLTEDDTDDIVALSCTNPTWTANGGSIGPVSGYIIYDDTTSDDTVIGCAEFDSDITVQDGFVLELTDINISIG